MQQRWVIFEMWRVSYHFRLCPRLAIRVPHPPTNSPLNHSPTHARDLLLQNASLEGKVAEMEKQVQSMSSDHEARLAQLEVDRKGLHDVHAYELEALKAEHGELMRESEAQAEVTVSCSWRRQLACTWCCAEEMPRRGPLGRGPVASELCLSRAADARQGTRGCG